MPKMPLNICQTRRKLFKNVFCEPDPEVQNLISSSAGCNDKSLLILPTLNPSFLRYRTNEAKDGRMDVQMMNERTEALTAHKHKTSST